MINHLILSFPYPLPITIISISKVTKEGKVGQMHYLHHHPVIRNDKTTIKFRVMFDVFVASKGPSFLNKNERFIERINYNLLYGCRCIRN